MNLKGWWWVSGGVLGGLMMAVAWAPLGWLPPGKIPVPLEAQAGTVMLVLIALALFTGMRIYAWQAGQKWVWFWGSLVFLGVWNAGATWWLGYATVPGAIFTILANTLLYWVAVALLPWSTGVILGARMGWIAWFSGFLAVEWLHFHWELRWPWLTLGYAVSEAVDWIQWYEWTGVQGGTLVLLLGGRLLAQVWFSRSYWRLLSGVLAGALLVGGFGVSRILQSRDFSSRMPMYVRVLQPNVDPYSEKFYTAEDELNLQLMRLAELSRHCPLGDTIEVIITPETAIPGGIWLHSLLENPVLTPWIQWVHTCEGARVILGATTFQLYEGRQTATARPIPGTSRYYDAFNSAVLLHPETIRVYHKELLVPGVETLPYHSVTEPILGGLMLDLGGISGSLGTQKFHPLLHLKDSLYMAVVICYESIFPEYVRDLLREHAPAGGKVPAIAVITNDGWWEHTPGHWQHFSYARVLAITFRRWVLRSANTGISALIRPDGSVLSWLPYEQEGVLHAWIPGEYRETLFLRVGNVVGRMGGFVYLLVILITITGWLTQSFRYHPRKWRKDHGRP